MTETLSEERLISVLRQIPAEYEDIFQVTIRQEISDQGLADDMAILTHLRQRQAEFAGGAFLRPDGRRGLVSLAGGHRLDEAFQLGEDELDASERRSTVIRIAVIVVVAVVLFAFLFGGRGGDDAVAASEEDENLVGEEGAAPTPEPIQALSGANETLQGIGGLGGALQLGRPASLELHFSQTGEVIALPIDPSRTTNKGELRYNSSVMSGENPVAVWLFGTVLNYAIGIPENMVVRLVAGDQIVLQTDTGAAFVFVVSSVEQRPNYATNELLQQDRVGMTLFALPASDEANVSVALASYDIAQETATLAQTNRFSVDSPFTVAGVTIAVTAFNFRQSLAGRLLVSLEGTVSGDLSDKQVLVGLTGRAEQTEALELDLTTGAFRLQFSLPSTVAGAGLAADFRVFPTGQLATVTLGQVPQFSEQLEVIPPQASLDISTGLATVVVTITNPYDGALLIAPDFFQLARAEQQGGDPIPYAMTDAQLPMLLEPAETQVMAVTFLPPEDGSPVLLTLGRTRWELAGFQP